MPFAIVQGSPITEVPRDLYIPPDALEVFLEAFEGPLDLLLYLIKRQNLDILDIPIALVTAQYMQYIDLMEEMHLELAGEYLVMAAMLAEIKSRMLLPRPRGDEEEEDDPRAELIRRLQEYERYKQAAEDMDNLPRYERDIFGTVVEFPYRSTRQDPPEVSLDAILKSFADVLSRAELFSHHHIQREALSVRERMSMVLERVRSDEFTGFSDLFVLAEGRAGVIVAFLAILELVRHHSVRTEQNDLHGEIWILPGESFDARIDLSQVDSYESRSLDAAELPVKPR